MLTTLLLVTVTLAATPMAEPPRVEAARLEAALKALPTKRSSMGDAAHLDGLEKTQAWLLEQTRALGYTPTTQKLAHGKRIKAPDPVDAAKREWMNVILDLPGKEEAGKLLIVGAHFDAVPDAPGADDNGSGVAALLEMARVLKDRPMKRSVRMIFFNLEEGGLQGSLQYADQFADRVAAKQEELVGMISLEMLGYYSDKPESQHNPFKALKGLELPTTGDFIALAGVLGARPFIRQLDEQMRKGEPECKTVVFDLSPIAPPDILRSDHAPFLGRGWPAVMITDTANFRNPHYHQPTDTVETIDMARLARTTSAVTQAVLALAGPVGEPDAPPANLEGLPDISQFMPKPEGTPSGPK